MWVGEFVQRRASASRCQRARNFGFPVTGAVNCLMWFLGSKFRSSSRASSVYSQLLNHLPSPFASSFMGESIFNLLKLSLHCNTQLCPDTYLENFLSFWLQADISSASPITRYGNTIEPFLMVPGTTHHQCLRLSWLAFPKNIPTNPFLEQWNIINSWAGELA